MKGLKKKVLGVLLTVAMIMGNIIPVMATESTETKTYAGYIVYKKYQSTTAYSEEVIEATAVSVNGELSGTAYSSSGDIILIGVGENAQGEAIIEPKLEFIEGFVGGFDLELCSVWNNGDSIYMETKGGAYGNGISIDYNLEINMKLIDTSTTYQISTPFATTAVSNRGDYDLAISGFFIKELADGTHTLTAAEITGQTISVVARNNINGVLRVMTQSTIEGLTVTVINGEVVRYVIAGRVQTSGGTLDRYTAIIEN